MSADGRHTRPERIKGRKECHGEIIISCHTNQQKAGASPPLSSKETGLTCLAGTPSIVCTRSAIFLMEKKCKQRNQTFVVHKKHQNVEVERDRASPAGLGCGQGNKAASIRAQKCLASSPFPSPGQAGNQRRKYTIQSSSSPCRCRKIDNVLLRLKK